MPSERGRRFVPPPCSLPLEPPAVCGGRIRTAAEAAAFRLLPDVPSRVPRQPHKQFLIRIL
ncbi:TPA: hypothetical protein ACFMWC_001289 [Neisseria lactamica]